MSASDYIKKVDEFLTVEGLKNNWTYLAVPAIFALAVFLRMIPGQGMEYFQALDPYMIYRMSEHLALSGNMPALDFLRYFPYETPTYLLNQGDILFPALFYWLGPFAIFGSFLEWAQFYPALMGGLGVVFMYLLGKELFDVRTGVLASFMLATISGVMQRTSAGFFEKEPLGTMFMMMSLWLFVRAWQKRSYVSGIGSGLAMGFFSISWGGSQMLWLMYPAVTGIMMMLNRETENLMAALTPTVVIGGMVASALNPSRFGLTNTLFLLNMAMVAFLWSRYLIEEFELIDSEYLPYYVPTASVVGGIVVLLSPLYSNEIAQRVVSVINLAVQDTGRVIGGTVAENTAASISQLVSQLGAGSAGQIHFSLGTVATMVGTWPLAFFGILFLLTTLVFKVLNIWDILETDVSGKEYLNVVMGVFTAWVIGFVFFFQQQYLVAGAGAAGAFLTFLLMYTYIDQDSLFSIMGMTLAFLIAGQIMGFLGGVAATYATLTPTVAVIAGVAFLYYTDNISAVSVDADWTLIIPAFWFLSNVLGAVAKSRLITLAAFPVALLAGYGAARILERLTSLNYSEVVSNIPASRVRAGVIGLFLVLTLSVNGAAGYATASGPSLQGQPNQLWMENLDFIRENTEEGSVILSWWDYGYHFQSIARRSTVADGGNFGYYTDELYGKTNYPVADWLTSDDPRANSSLVFERHSVDHIVLDSTMIGKYSAVSQISNRDNSQFQSMITLSTPNINQALSRSGNRTVMQFQDSRTGLRAYAPVDTQGSDVSVSGAVEIETGRGRIQSDCLLTENGEEILGEGNTSESGYCVAEHPYYTMENAIAAGQQNQNIPARLVMVPKAIKDANLVKLYLQDGHGVPFAEKVEGGSNGYIKMWNVTERP